MSQTWKAEREAFSGRAIVSSNGYGESPQLICRPNRTRECDESQIASLIAAAPELLKALAALSGLAELDCMDDKSNAWRSAMLDANEALEKAAGK